MALKQLILARKIEERSTELSNLLNQRSALEKREAELEAALEEAKTEEEVETVSQSAEELEKEIQELNEKIEKIQSELTEKKEELEKINEKETEENRSMKKRKTVQTHEGEQLDELRSGINGYVRSKGAKRDGFTSVEGGALIPEELLTPQETPEDVVDLRNYVKVVPVNSRSGKYPVISKSGSKMVTVEELKANPELQNPTIVEIDYSIDTRRGYIPLSQEVIDDADYDVTGLIADEIEDQSRNTSNMDIAAVLKTATPKAVQGLDGLKTLVNKDIKKVYDVKFIVSASLYNVLDQLKDKNGRYLLQESITTASGKVLLGKELVVLDDDMIGTNEGDLVGFVGDAKAHTAYFDRNKASVQWIDNNLYGKLLAGMVRYDVEKTDTEAGFYITFTADKTLDED